MNHQCRLCNSCDLSLYKKSDIVKGLSADDFRITNKEYGMTGELWKCNVCGFIQCEDIKEVLGYYKEMNDDSYEATRRQRALQEKEIMAQILKFKGKGNLLDIGAGSGILVEEALKYGFQAQGIEPSAWLCAKAKENGLPITQGYFPDSSINLKFDIISMVDVLEHVIDPVSVIKNAYAALKAEGIILITTPDVDSFFSRVMGNRWWHMRIAHVGYFKKKNLKDILVNNGFTIEHIIRPKWYFSVSYLFERVKIYLPFLNKIHLPDILAQITIPINLADSYLIIGKKYEH